MARRIISIGVTALMLLSVLVVLNVFPVDNVRGEVNAPHDDGVAPDAQAGDGIWTTDGSWTINLGDTITHADKTIVVNGNLIIEEGASLTLTGVTLMMNCTTNGEFRIEVEAGSGFNGGQLTIQDSGGTPSVITSYNEDGAHNFGFLVYGHPTTPSRDGHLDMTNSELRYCGYDNVDAQFKDLGLWINSRNNVIDGNFFYNCTNAVNYINLATDGPGGPNTFQNNNVSVATNGTYVRGATGITIDNNEFYECIEGMNFNISANAVVTNNRFDMIYRYAAYFGQTSTVTFNYNTVENLQGFLTWVYAGVVFSDFSSNIEARFNTMHNMPYTGMGAFYCTGDVTYSHNSFDDYYRGVAFGIHGANTATMYRNTAGANTTQLPGYDSVAFWASQVTGTTNIIENTGYNALQTLYSNWGAGIQLWGVDEATLTGNIIQDNEYSGIYILDSGNNSLLIENNLLVDNGIFGISMDEPSDPPSWGGVHNPVINNNVINGSLGGIIGFMGTNHKYTNNTLDGSSDIAIGAYIDNTYVANNHILNTGDGSVTYQGGIAILPTTANPVIENVVAYNNDITDSVGFATYPVAGIVLEDADNILIEECTLDGNEVGVYSYDASTNVLIENCSITDGIFTDNSFIIDGDSHLTTLNTTFTNSTIDVQDAISTLTTKWFLHVQVRQGASGQNGATVTTEDIFGGDFQTFTTTNNENMEPGWVKWIQLTEFVNTGGTRDDHTPHWVNATHGSAEALAQPNMWMSHAIQLDLNEVPTTDTFTVGANVVFRTDTIYLFINGSDVEDWESDFNVEFEYRDPNELSWNTTYLDTFLYYDSDSNPNNDVGYWYVAFTPPVDAITGFYDFRGRVQDTYGSWSPWVTLLNSIDIRNNLPDVIGMYKQTISGDAGPGALYRGGNTWIYGSGDDVEDGDDQNFPDAQFQYKRPTGAWGAHSQYWNPNSPSKGDNNWYQNFEPPGSIDVPVGIYEFRVRFQDIDDDWGNWGELEQMDVWNNPPRFVGFNKAAGFVYRGNTVRVYADVADIEEAESDLMVHFYYKLATDVTWADTWMTSNGLWDGFSFYADFNPPDTAELGLYEFMIEITDHESVGVDGDTIQETPAGTSIEVRNNAPVPDNVKSSRDTIRAGIETVFIHVNATDFEDQEQYLKIDRIEWRENNSETQSPPTDIWHTDSNKININLDEGYSPSGYIRASMSPTSNAYLGRHDIRVRVVDLDGESQNGLSYWMYLHNAFTVQNPKPILDDITLQYHEVFRGDTVYITLNATDLGQDEDDLTVEVQYRKVGGTWTDITVTTDMYVFSSGGYWEIPFSPGIDWLDSQLGDYEFHGRVKNDAGGISDDGAWRLTDQGCEVRNNVPESISLSAEDSTVERGSSILIFVNGNDREESEDDLDVQVEYSTDGGTSWEDDYLDDLDYNTGDSQWEITFSPDSDGELGDYDFRVRFYDGEDYSDWYSLEDLVEVTNAKPVVTSLTIDEDTMFRMDSVTLTAVVTDADEDSSSLTPNFQYKGSTGGWVSQDAGGSYFGDANAVGANQWEITFEPPAGADIGDYSFRVEFTDSAGDTSEMDSNSEITNALEVQNAEPTVEIDSPSSGSQDSAKITFEATASDDEDSSLTYFWDFGDGDTSTEESPEHEYSEAGDYEITLTVTDSDGGEAEDTISIVISGDTVGGGDFPLMLLLLLLIPLIVVILVLVLLLSRKKKKPEAAPPPAMAPAPGAPPAAAPPAMAPPASPPAAPGAPPPAAPAAAPMAAPAAAPAAGAQNIKCPKCGTPFTVTDTTRPLTIECPNCHAKGTLK
jgi:parallel beta-helix repeat protein